MVGSNPSSGSKFSNAFDPTTKSGKTLHSWIKDIDATIYLTNVATYPTIGNRPLTASQIKVAIPELQREIEYFGVKKYVAVGKTAARALTLMGLDFYEMPHPSGLNRQLNDPKFIGEKIKGLLNYLEIPSDESN